MDDIRRVLRLASWRLFALDVLRTLAVMLTIGLSGLLVTRVVEKLFGFNTIIEPLWPRIFAWTGAGVVGVAALWSFARRHKVLAVARELDERAELKESLSTALCFEKDPDPWAKAVIETATQRARGVHVAQAIPMELPRLWPVPVAVATAFYILWISLPNIDLSGRFKQQQVAQEKARQVVEVKEARAADKKKMDELLAKAKVDVKDDKGDENAENMGKEQKELDPDALNRKAVKELTDLSEKLGQLKENEKNAQLDAMKEAMKQLKQPNDGPLNEFSRSLARGDFNKAQAAMEQISKQLAEGSLSPEQSKAAKDQLNTLAKELERIAENKEEVQKQLEKAGLDAKKAAELAKKAMADPEAIKKALEEMKNLSPAQKEQMMKMAQAASEACKNAGNMSDAMSKMAQGMTQEGLQQEGMEGMESLQQQLSQMENMQNDMQNLDAALKEAKAQLEELGKCMGNCNKPGEGEGEGMGDPSQQGSWRQGSSDRYGKGSGGPGKGDGSSRPEEEADFTYDKKKANGQTTQGQIIGNRLVYGQQVRGESKAEFSAAVEAGVKAAAEAMETQTVAREYHGPMKHYFGSLQAKVKADKPTISAPVSPDAKPDAKTDTKPSGGGK